MSQIKSRASRFGGRLFQSAASSALALSALAGGVLLSGGEAKALVCTFDAANPGIGGSINNCTYVPGGPAPVNPVTGGYYKVWYETNPTPTDKDIWFISGPSKGKGNIEWKWFDVNGNQTWLIPPDDHSVDEWHVDVDFDPDFAMEENPPPPAAHDSVFEYVVIIDKGQGGVPHMPWNDPGNAWFEDVTLGAMFGPNIETPPPPGQVPSFVTKEIYEAICTSSTPGGIFDSCTKGNLIDTLTVTAAGPATDTTGEITDLHLDKLYIIDTASARNNLIDAYQNVYRQAPGPLPILGAGAAFGFSRKLRSRIKGSRAA